MSASLRPQALLGPVALLIALLVAGPAAAQDPVSPELLLKQAIHQEVVSGNLEAAIQLYRQVADAEGVRPATAAEALLRLGRAYEQLGRSEARGAYERLLRDYPDQNELASDARRRLAALRTAMAEPPSLAIEKVMDMPGGFRIVSAITPDGRRLVAANFDADDVEIIDIETGSSQMISEGRGLLTDEYGGFPLIVRVSSDGRWVASNWEDAEDYSWYIRLDRFDGSETKTIYQTSVGGYIQPEDWSPDGRYLAALLDEPDQRTDRVILLDTITGERRDLIEGDFTAIPNVRFSPDGTMLAFDLHKNPLDGNSDIMLLDIDTGRSRGIVPHGADDRVLGWVPSENYLLFISDRRGSYDLYAVQARTLDDVSDPEVILTEFGRSRLLGFAEDGTFYYEKQYGGSDLVIQEFDYDQGRLVGEPVSVDQRRQGGSLPLWSPSGRYLFYFSPEDDGIGRVNYPRRSIAIMDVDAGEQRILIPDLGISVLQPVWTSDETALILRGRDASGREGIFRLDLNSGSYQLLRQVEPESESVFNWRLSPDQQTMYFRRVDTEKPEWQIMARDLRTGRETVLVTGGSLIDVSPCGEWLVYSVKEQEVTRFVQPLVYTLFRIPAGGGEAVELGTVPGAPFYPPRWEGETFQFVHLVLERVQTEQGLKSEYRRTELWTIPLDGSGPTVEEIASRNPRMQPGGNLVAYSQPLPSRPCELWRVRNILERIRR